MKQFTVDADRETGEWIDDTLHQIEDIDGSAHYLREDTDKIHFDTFEDDHDRTCAVQVRWID